MGGAAHFRIVIIASLAGILFGFDTAVIAGVTSALREIFSLSPTGLGAAVSSALWGTLLGALIIGGSSVLAPIFPEEITPAFAFFAGMMALQFIAAFFLMPETHGVALERMHE